VVLPLIELEAVLPGEWRFTSTFDGTEFFLRDHRIHGRRVLPGAAYIEMARAASASASGGAVDRVELSSMLWPRAFVLDDEPRAVTLRLRASADGDFRVDVTSLDSSSVVYCRGVARSRPAGGLDEALDIEDLYARCDVRVGAREFYARFSAEGIEYGPAHQVVTALRTGPGITVARLALPEALAAGTGGFVAHPALLDAALQAARPLAGEAGTPAAFVPFSVRRVTIGGPCQSRMWAVARRGTVADAMDIDLCDDQGIVVTRLEGYVVREMPRTP
jgi:polyketide synthase PksN